MLLLGAERKGGWDGWNNRKTDAEEMKLKSLFCVAPISLKQMRSLVERSWDWCVLGASRKWTFLDRGFEKVSTEPTRAQREAK